MSVLHKIHNKLVYIVKQHGRVFRCIFILFSRKSAFLIDKIGNENKIKDAASTAHAKQNDYHSFTLFASIFRKINSKMVKPQSPEPP